MDAITATLALWVAFTLANPSFEPPYIQVSQSSQVPPGWGIVQWEGDPKGVETGPIYDPYWYRRSDGIAGLKIINPFAPMHVWVTQRVFLPAQTRLRFEVDVHGWYVAGGDPQWDGDIPLSSDPVSQACAFVSRTPPPFPPDCALQVVNDPPFKRLVAEGDGEGWVWVGVYLTAPAGQNNDFYVDSAAAFVASVPLLSPTPTPTLTPPARRPTTPILLPSPTPPPFTPTLLQEDAPPSTPPYSPRIQVLPSPTPLFQQEGREAVVWMTPMPPPPPLRGSVGPEVVLRVWGITAAVLVAMWALLSYALPKKPRD